MPHVVPAKISELGRPASSRRPPRPRWPRHSAPSFSAHSSASCRVSNELPTGLNRITRAWARYRTAPLTLTMVASRERLLLQLLQAVAPWPRRPHRSSKSASAGSTRGFQGAGKCV
jgi:hypothetical protein